MELKEYFDTVKGTGIMATADGYGKVDAAVYSRPHFMEDGALAFIMADRLTHHNLQSNPCAVYLFVEEGPRFLVFFQLEKVLPLIGAGREEDTL